jgi:hypothetical protein
MSRIEIAGLAVAAVLLAAVAVWMVVNNFFRSMRRNWRRRRWRRAIEHSFSHLHPALLAGRGDRGSAARARYPGSAGRADEPRPVPGLVINPETGA